MDPKGATAQEYAGRLTRAGKETVSAQLALARHSADLARATAAGEKTVPAAGREYLEAVLAEWVRLGTQTGELVRLQLDGVAAAGASLASAVFQDRTRNGGAAPSPRHIGGAKPTASTSQNRAPAAPVAQNRAPAAPVAQDRAPTQPSDGDRPAPAAGAVALHGPIGGVAEGSVVVANRHPRKRVVRLAADQLTDEAGRASVAVLEVEPNKFTVPAGQEHAFRLAVRLAQGEVTSGATYVSVLRISGGEEATVRVTVRVD